MIGRVAASPGHASEQVAPVPHEMEQLPVHSMLQVELGAQVTLLLGPTVRSQVEPWPQSTLHDAPQVPVQALSIGQSSEQLACSHADPPRSQLVPASH